MNQCSRCGLIRTDNSVEERSKWMRVESKVNAGNYVLLCPVCFLANPVVPDDECSVVPDDEKVSVSTGGKLDSQGGELHPVKTFRQLTNPAFILIGRKFFSGIVDFDAFLDSEVPEQIVPFVGSPEISDVDKPPDLLVVTPDVTPDATPDATPPGNEAVQP